MQKGDFINKRRRILLIQHFHNLGQFFVGGKRNGNFAFAVVVFRHRHLGIQLLGEPLAKIGNVGREGYLHLLACADLV